MEILKASVDWARAEVFSSTFFILFGVIFMVASVSFWHLGKTDISKSYIVPTFIAGLLLMIIGSGLFFANKVRISQFENAYNKNPKAFIESEKVRVDKTIGEYRTVVFKAIPVIIIISSLLIIFINTPIWRASSITVIAMMVVILLIDGTAKDRIENYNKTLMVKVRK